MSLAMTKDEREKFLAALHVGVISMEDPGRGPLTVPIWYMYEPGGELWVITDRDSRKGKLLKAGTRISSARNSGASTSRRLPTSARRVAASSCGCAPSAG